MAFAAGFAPAGPVETPTQPRPITGLGPLFADPLSDADFFAALAHDSGGDFTLVDDSSPAR
jgi:hypothetical protein